MDRAEEIRHRLHNEKHMWHARGVGPLSPSPARPGGLSYKMTRHVPCDSRDQGDAAIWIVVHLKDEDLWARRDDRSAEGCNLTLDLQTNLHDAALVIMTNLYDLHRLYVHTLCALEGQFPDANIYQVPKRVHPLTFYKHRDKPLPDKCVPDSVVPELNMDVHGDRVRVNITVKPKKRKVSPETLGDLTPTIVKYAKLKDEDFNVTLMRDGLRRLWQLPDEGF